MTHVRHLMRLELGNVAGAHRRPADLRTFHPDDVPDLAALMLDAYAGTVDFEAGATLGDATAELQALLRGEYGTFLPEFSRVAEVQGHLVGAVLVTRWGPDALPFVAFTMTAAKAKGQGIARQTMTAVLVALQQAGEGAIQLVVMADNTPAVRLYGSLGFRVMLRAVPTSEPPENVCEGISGA